MKLESLKQIKRVFSEICYFKRLLNRYAEFLLPGRYSLYPTLRAIVADNPASKEKAKPYFDKKTSVSKSAKLILKANQLGFFRNKKGGDLEKFEAIYSANNYDAVREIKLFSFERKEILTVCTCAEACQRQLQEYAALHEFFGMPRVSGYDALDNAYKICMVTLVPRISDVCALENISQCISAYGAAHPAKKADVSVSQLMEFSYACSEFNDLLNKLAQKCDLDGIPAEVPLCFQHGDLSRDNLIYGDSDGKTDFWWIDFEHAGARVFFYDYFFYILNTALYYSDTSALDAYFTGVCDEHLKAFFSQFGWQYDPALRKDYFMIFAIAFLKERVCDLGNLAALRMYCDFINKTVLDKEWN